MVSKESKRFCNKRVSHHLSRKKERKKEREYYAMSDDANVAQHSFATLQMAKHIPQLGHLRAAAVNDVRKPFFLQPLFTFLSSPTSSAVRDYRSVLFERLQNIYVRSARRFLRSIEWHVESVWPFLGSAICDWEYPV